MTRLAATLWLSIVIPAVLAAIAATGVGFGWLVGTVAGRIQADPYGPVAWLTATLACVFAGLVALALIVHHTWRNTR